VIGDFYHGPDYEKISELEPDIVWTYGPESDHYSNCEDVLDPLGITVVRLDLVKSNTYAEEVMKLGYMLGEQDRAKEFIEFFQEDCIDFIKENTEKLSEGDKPRVYLEYSTKTSHITSGAGQDLDQMCTIAGGINIAADLIGKPKVDSEWVIDQNPDIMIKSKYGSCGYGEDDPAGMIEIRDKIMKGEDIYTGWEYISAVNEEKVYILATDIYAGPAGFIGTAYYAKWIQPQLFEDMDPQAIHQEYLTKFQGLDYDLSEHGVFVYPPLES